MAAGSAAAGPAEPWRGAGQSRIWVPTPFLELLADDLTAPVAIAEAWLWPQSSAWLEAAGHSFRDARAALGGRQRLRQCARCIALHAIKNCYTSQIGNFARRPATAGIPATGARRASRTPATRLRRPRRQRPHHLKALANDYRRLARIGKATGRWPVAIFNDAVYYASDIQDGRQAEPARHGPRHRARPVQPRGHRAARRVSAELGERGFHRAVERYLRGPR